MKRAAQSPAKRRKAKLADTPEDKAIFRAMRAIRVGGPRPRFDLSNPASLRGALWYELEKVFDDRTPAARKKDQEFARWLERDRRRRKQDTSRDSETVAACRKVREKVSQMSYKEIRRLAWEGIRKALNGAPVRPVKRMLREAARSSFKFQANGPVEVQYFDDGSMAVRFCAGEGFKIVQSHHTRKLSTQVTVDSTGRAVEMFISDNWPARFGGVWRGITGILGRLEEHKTSNANKSRSARG